MNRMFRTRLVAVLLACAAVVPLYAQQDKQDKQDKKADGAPARLTIRVPAGATLVIEGVQTKTSGTVRIFESPNLTPGKAYTYTIKASWTQNGKPMTAERQVEVAAGKRIELELPERIVSKGTNTTIHTAGTAPKARDFIFTYSATVTGLEPDKVARIWLPVPPSNSDQEVSIVKQELPAQGKIGSEPKYGNKILFVEAKANSEGNVPVSVTYRVRRFELKGDMTSPGADMREMALFLKPDAKVPNNAPKALALLEGKNLPGDQFQAGRVLYDIVDEHMRYSKEGTGWGQGDVNWACDSKYGNCCDFHSLFISLARSKNMPAKFEMGFPIPTARGQGDVAGYHCWAKFKPEGRGWIPVDISEADKDPKMKEYYFGNLTEDRVTFTTGRDIDLVPKQDGPALNFFVYPYVEVDGKPYPADKVKRKFAYEDVTARTR